MFARHRGCWLLFLGAALSVLLNLSPAQAYLIIFKDGHVIRGKIRQAREYIVDRISGRAFSVPMTGMPYSIETPTSFITFSPSEIHDIVEEQPTPTPQWMYMELYGRKGGTSMPKEWWIDETGAWDERWERNVRLATPFQKFIVPQRITHLTPEFVRVRAMTHLWSPFYRIEEFGPGTIQQLVSDRFKKKKEVPEYERHIKVAKFLAQAGWTAQARQELESFKTDSPTEQEAVRAELEILQRVQALRFVHDLERAEELGRHQEAQQRVQKFFQEDMSKLVEEKHVLQVYDVKSRYEQRQERLQLAQKYLKELPERLSIEQQPFYKEAAETILAELNFDTLPRLETFLDLLRVHELARAQSRQPNETDENLLAFAVSGWVIGNLSAEGNTEAARQLWDARKFVHDYHRTSGDLTRANLRKQFLERNKTGIDLLVRTIRLLPPTEPHDKLDTTVQEMGVRIFGAAGYNGTYLLQLPPEYNHQRAYPVLLVLHKEDEQPQDMLQRWSALAAENGYILAAPRWASGARPYYHYSEAEHDLVLGCLRDLRRRFQIDSDRVFLFGANEGGQMAFDVGLSHPDQFAGVLPMCAYPRFFARKYWPNAQYLPLYVVDGNYHVESAKENNTVCKDWVRWHYPVLFVEYKSRAKELFIGEFPDMMKWMNHKRRVLPLHQVGSLGTGYGSGEEFCTMRNGDNHFYWLSTSGLNPRYINRAFRYWNNRLEPARIQATIFSQNEIHFHSTGLTQASIWIAPGMIDFAQKVKISANRNPPATVQLQPNLEVLMEDFVERGDRQRLFLARIDLGGAPR